MNLFEKYPDRFEWFYLSVNPSITPEFIERHIDKGWYWNWVGLSENPIITPDFVEKHMDKDWHWHHSGLSTNSSITIEFVERHMDKSWSWGNCGLSSNPSITPEFIEKHADRFDNLSSCPNLFKPFPYAITWEERIHAVNMEIKAVGFSKNTWTRTGVKKKIDSFFKQL